MDFTTIEVPGVDAIQALTHCRERYAETGLYPFLIGDAEDLGRVEEAAEFNPQDPAEVIKASFEVSIADWIAANRKDAEEFEFSPTEILGEWPRKNPEMGSICLHKDIVSKKIKPKVYLGLARIEEPWHLPAVLKYGGWNECPDATIQCAFYRSWQERFGAEITGMSGDTVECAVKRPPTNRDDAIALAWEQYWYCGDIVDQGCSFISNLAATIMNSPYWFFWWD
jgi:hypothetical protein